MRRGEEGLSECRVCGESVESGRRWCALWSDLKVTNTRAGPCATSGRRVLRVPAGVPEHVAQDHQGRLRVVVAHADERARDPFWLAMRDSSASASDSARPGEYLPRSRLFWRRICDGTVF